MKDLVTLRNMLYHLFIILNKKQRTKMLGMFVVILIGSAFELLGVSAMLPFVQSILSPKELMDKDYLRFLFHVFRVEDSHSVIAVIGIGIIIIYVVKNIYLSFSGYLQASYSNKTRKELAIMMLQSYINRPYSFFIEQGTSAISQGVNTDTEGVYQVIKTLFLLLSELLVIISVMGYLILIDWVLASGVLLVGISCMLIIVFGLKKKISEMSSAQRKAQILQGKWFYRIVGGIKDILVYGRQYYFVKGYESAYEDTCRTSTNFTFISGLPERVIEGFCVVGILSTVLVRLRMGVDSNAFIPRLSVFAMGAFRLLPSISRVTGHINSLVFYRGYLESAYMNVSDAKRFQNVVLKRTEPFRRAGSENETVFDFQNNIKICNLYWKYKDAKRYVLEDLSLVINKGETIGIIGESGAGKSTFADVVLRLHHPEKGELLMDGINIESIPNTWSHIIGYVPQSVYLLDDTVRANIVFGSDQLDDKEVWNALRKASLDNYISDLDDGLDAMVGERGVKLSGGQQQRIALARALYANPQILILDEATSALDNETEEAVMEAIDALAGSITMIIIAHRVTTLRNCDKIYEIVNGKAIKRDKSLVLGINQRGKQ